MLRRVSGVILVLVLAASTGCTNPLRPPEELLTDGASQDGPVGDTACTTPDLTVLPSADTYVEEENPDTNHGTSSRLVVDNAPEIHAYLLFQVTGTSGAVSSARLRLHVQNASTNGPTVYSTTTGWQEETLIWTNRPGSSGSALADLGDIPLGWTEIDLGATVTGDGSYAFVLLPTSDDGMDVSSREGAEPPQLVIGFCGS